MSITRRNLIIGAAATALPFSRSAFATSKFPSKTLRIIVPFAPGGSNDMIARLMASHLPNFLGQTVVVENRAGAGGAIGAQTVSRSEPDGYTILFHSSTFIIQPNLIKDIGYNYQDFVPVSLLTEAPLLVEISPKLPVNNFAEFLAYARSEKNEVFFGSPGHGSTAHLAAEMFNKLARTHMIHVPFQGNAPATNALLSGDVQVTFDIIPIAKPLAEAGRVRLLATTGKTRSPLLPSLPTVSESGIPDFSFTFWQGMSLPKNTPEDIARVWHDAITKTLAVKEVQDNLLKQGNDIVALPPSAFKSRMDRESALWAQVVQEANIKI